MSLRTSEAAAAGARTPAPPHDRGRLARDLGREVRGDVRFDDGARAAFANDASIYRQAPVGVVQPPLLQHHCHQHAVIGHEADHRVMAAAGLEVTRPDSGCCGMAGSFGYEAGEKYDVSVACAKRMILPAVRAAADDTVVLADGSSCRSQIADLTGRRPLHLAQVLALRVRIARDRG